MVIEMCIGMGVPSHGIQVGMEMKGSENKFSEGWKWELNYAHRGNGTGNELTGMRGNGHVASHACTSLVGTVVIRALNLRFNGHEFDFWNKKHLKNVGPICYCEPPLHCRSPGVASRTPSIAIAQAACDVHNDDDDDNDNA